MLFFPLVASSEESLTLLDSLRDISKETANGFTQIGIGIASIFFLIVVFYYVASILDGGKFQIKMLMPLLIYLIVCNFNIVSQPVVSFTSTLTKSLCDACDSKKEAIKNKNGCDAGATLNDMYMRSNENEANEISQKKVNSAMDNGGEEEEDTGGSTWLGRRVKEGVVSSANKGSLNLQKETSIQGLDVDGGSTGNGNTRPIKPTEHNFSFMQVFSGIVGFFAVIMSYILSCFGAVMSSLVIAFGPITFAFAVIPGQAGTIKSWFIRLCQFAIWSPLCALVDCLVTQLYDTLATASSLSGGCSIILPIALALCNMAVLASIPSIASMIIEGASGGASLSQGLHAISGGLTTAGGMLAGGAKMIGGSDNALASLGAGFSAGGGIKGFASKAMSGGFKSALNETVATGRNVIHHRHGMGSGATGMGGSLGGNEGGGNE